MSAISALTEHLQLIWQRLRQTQLARRAVSLFKWMLQLPVSVQFLIVSVLLFIFVQSNFEYYSYNPFFTYLLNLRFTKLFSIIGPFDFMMRLLLNLLILFSLQSLLYAITGRSQMAMILTTAIVLLLHQANHVKFIHLRDAIAVENLLYLNQIPEVIKHGYLPLYQIAVIALLIAGLVPLWRFLQSHFSKVAMRQRIRWAIISISFFALFAIPKVNIKAAQIFRLEKHYYSQALSMKDNGFFAALATDVSRTVNRKKADTPPGYSKEEIERIVLPFRQSNRHIAAQSQQKEKVQIIIYLMESFWDPMQFKELAIKEDPIAVFRNLQKQSVHFGNMYSPTFGGFTVQAEFELLTGLSTHLAHDTAYRTIDRPGYSLASYISNVRQSTNLFVTSHNAWFWDRSRILPRFGFQVLKEQTDFKCRDYKGAWNCPSEACLIEEANRFMKSEIPNGNSSVVLLNGVQNHGPYDKPYTNRSFQVSGDLSETDQTRLQTNLNHLQDLSDSLKQLIKSIEKRHSQSKVIVLAFGDHLPGGYDFYKDQTTDKLHQTPFLIWSNQRSDRQRSRNKHRQHIQLMGANYLPNLALEASGVELLPVHRFMQMVRQKLPVIRPEIASMAKEQLYAATETEYLEILSTEPSLSNISKKDLAVLRDFAMIQYDLLHGNGYALQIKDRRNAKNEFN